jgi:hypothetical protein
MKSLLNEILAYFGLVAVPIKPSKGLLNSMAIRYDHGFGMSCGMSDKEIEEMRKNEPIMGRQFRTLRERESMLTTMGQLHEEVVGMGFYQEWKEEEYTIL